MAIETRAITGLVLAGGRGRRMGGVDKGLQLHGGIALAEHARRRLAPQVGLVAVNANRHLERYRSMSADVWPDDPPAFVGPLAGIMAGLTHATTPYLVIVPCDSPFFPHDLVARLAEALSRQQASIAMAFTREGDLTQAQPVFCLMKVVVREHLDAAMRRGQRKIMDWARELPLAEVMFDDASAFANVNTLAELQALPPAGPHAQPLASIALSLDGYSAQSLPIDVACAFLARVATPVDGIEPVALQAALGRVLADDAVSGLDVPPHDNAAMDGYALRHADLTVDASTRVTVVGRSLAGSSFDGVVGPMQGVRITTGAVMPCGLDTVVPQELVIAGAVSGAGLETVVVPCRAVRAGDHRRLAGEDLRRGAVALRAGRVLTPSDLGLLASLGHSQAPVRPRLRVAIVTTGSELRSAGDALDGGAIYDSNRHTLAAMLERIGVVVIDLGTTPDEPQALKALLASAAEQADAVITTGGVGVGDADHTRAVLAELGDVLFWGLAMRPGRPMAIGRIRASPSRTALLFGLPGNPVAVMVTFYALVRDALLCMAGAVMPPRLPWRAVSRDAIRKKPGRTEFLRGIVEPGPDGELHVRLTGSQGSGILRSMSEANALVVLGHERGEVTSGERVDVWPFEGLI